MTRPSSSKTVFICVFHCVFDIRNIVGLSLRNYPHIHVLIIYLLIVFKYFQGWLLSSSFQQNWFHLFRTSFAKDMTVPVCKKEVQPFLICYYNILLDYDVYMHNLVVLVMVIPTRPRSSKTESGCKRYCNFSFTRLARPAWTAKWLAPWPLWLHGRPSWLGYGRPPSSGCPKIGLTAIFLAPF